MKNLLFVHLAVYGLLLLQPAVQAQSNSSSDQLWQERLSSQRSTSFAEPWIQPPNAKEFQLDTQLIESLLSEAPKEFSTAARSAAQIISVPMPDGSYSRFAIEETDLMHPDLAAKFPEIKTYIGRGIDDPAATARFDWTPKGFHAQILKPSGAVFIDPAENHNNQLYSSYAVAGYTNPDKEALNCLVQGSSTSSRTTAAMGLTSGSSLRTLRLAVACTGEYATFHGGTVASALAAVVTTINRVSGLYEQEISVRFQLISNNNLLMFTDATTDPYTNNDGFEMLFQNTTTINDIIGVNNFDIGHVVSTGGGGIAGLAVVCGVRKAEGVTGLPDPIGDPFDIDYVCHEIGHQFGGNHTFNGDSGSCGGNINPPTAYEPGSGSSIQAYTGICGNDDLQFFSEPYFHSESHAEMFGFVNSLSCGVATPTGNMPPTINAGNDYTIPPSTPFELTGAGADGDGDIVTYSWEQRDLGPQQDVNDGDNGASPLFRFWSPTISPTRVFPRYAELVNNTTIIGETLPTTSRTMNFRCTVRDNRAGGGGVNSDDMQVTVDNTSAPFQVTSPNTQQTLFGSLEVTWNVAGTSGGAINTPNVDIFLSIDGGFTYPTLLASSVPNTGSANVILPNINNATARIKVRGHDNIFFDISNANFTIIPDNGLSISPNTSLDSSGLLGGPFTPECQTYTLVNKSSSNLSWQATSGHDWVGATPASGTLAVGATGTVDVCIQNVATFYPVGGYETMMTFTNLSNQTAQTLDASLIVIPLGGTLQFSQTDFSTTEGGAATSITVSRSGDFTGTVGLYYATGSGTATQPADYISKTGNLTWGHGDTSDKSFTVNIIDDTVLEDDETIFIQLGAATGGAVIGNDDLATLTIEDNDINDLCEKALLIESTPFTRTASTDDATSTDDPLPSCATNSGNAVWFSYVAPSNGTFIIDTAGSDYNTTLTAFTGSCGALTEVDCNNNTGAGNTSEISLIVTQGSSYRFMAGGFNGAVGSLTVNATLLATTEPDFDNDGIPDATDFDDDNDKIPDAWEILNGLNFMDASDASTDIDGDGATGLEEYIADTSPTNALSKLDLSIEAPVTTNEQPLTFDTSIARDYFIQYRPSLSTGNWMPGPTNITGSGTMMNVIITNPAPVLYYRLGAEFQ